MQQLLKGANVKQRTLSMRHQAGMVLLEGLIAVLLFSIGILSIVGMQGAAVRASSDAKYRADAGMLVNQLIGQMWAADRTPGALQTTFQGGGGVNGTGYASWRADVENTLPGASANPPTVTFTLVPAGIASGLPTTQVNITVWWLAAGEPSGATPHQYSVVTQIGG